MHIAGELNFAVSVSASTLKSTIATLNNLFGPDVGLLFSTDNPNANLNINIGFIAAGSPTTVEPGTEGFVPAAPNGDPQNQGIVDFGQLLFLQDAYGASDAALGAALGRVAGHELGHELYVGHNHLGEGLMAASGDTFVPDGFTDTDKTNILNRCLFLQRGPQPQ